jgi:hypothetical protein
VTIRTLGLMLVVFGLFSLFVLLIVQPAIAFESAMTCEGIPSQSDYLDCLESQ